jgi:hypothetical protein
MEAICSSEMSASDYETKRCRNPEKHNLEACTVVVRFMRCRVAISTVTLNLLPAPRIITVSCSTSLLPVPSSSDNE